MPCYHPLEAFKAPGGGIAFNTRHGYADVPLKIGCGRCIGCRLERSRQWAVRCMHEAQLHEENCFLTLTYDDAHLPPGGSLVLRDFVLFMKKLRRVVSPRRFSYFHCGEYGEQLGRPHYHALLFGLDFPDKVARKRSAGGSQIFTSAILDRIWRMGQCMIGALTFESAAYCARYSLKKITGPGAREHYTRITEDGEIVELRPEYVTMSRRPGIGKRWFERFGAEVYPADEVIARGQAARPPRYYDKQLAELELRQVQLRRLVAGNSPRARRERAPERLAAREAVKKASMNLYRRELDK